jgi:hypothetical protein
MRNAPWASVRECPLRVVRNQTVAGSKTSVSSRSLTLITALAWFALFALLTLGQDAGSSCIGDQGCGAAGELVWIATLVLLPGAIFLTVAAVIRTMRDARRSSRSD